MSTALSKVSLLALLALGAGVGSAIADEALTTAQRDSVRYRARPAYDAVGIHAGGFTVFPKATIGETYNDNIYATDVNEQDDFITTLGAAVEVNSNWSRHALNFSAGLTQFLYADQTDENRLDWNLGVNGALDITQNSRLSGGTTYSQLHEDRGDPNAVAAAVEPTEYTLWGANAQFDQKFNRVTARVSGSVNDFDYDDVENTIGGIIDQDDRDRKVYLEALRLGYDVSPDTNLYIEGSLNQRDYDEEPPVVAVDRNSDGYAVVAGSEFRLSNLAQGKAFIGYQEQTYDSPLFPKIDGLDYGASVEWYVTGLTTVTFDAASTVEETTTAGASGYLAQTVDLRVDHELMRNLLLNGNVGYGKDDYEGVSRTDDIIRAGLGLDYLMNRNFSVGVAYDYTDRDSDLAGSDYKRNQVGLKLTGKL